jgi:hypothetical protein
MDLKNFSLSAAAVLKEVLARGAIDKDLEVSNKLVVITYTSC